MSFNVNTVNKKVFHSVPCGKIFCVVSKSYPVLSEYLYQHRFLDRSLTIEEVFRITSSIFNEKNESLLKMSILTNQIDSIFEYKTRGCLFSLLTLQVFGF